MKLVQLLPSFLCGWRPPCWLARFQPVSQPLRVDSCVMALGNNAKPKREELAYGPFDPSVADWWANSDHHLAGSIAPLARQGICSIGGAATGSSERSGASPA